ncbi:MAG: bifunctional DNA primase/polymerase [Azospirillaceae bacterium]
MTTVTDKVKTAVAGATNFSKCDWALYLAQKGFHIFPLSKGSKSPVKGESWTELATTDSETIKNWFKYREGMNYGICPMDTGVIVDLDKKPDKNIDGEETFGALELEHGSVETFTVRTPSGGKHLYLMTPYPVGNHSSFGPGVDVRGSGGYVVGPGSELVEGLCKQSDKPGSYTVETTLPVASAPPWCLDRMRHGGSEKAEHRDIEPDRLDTLANVQLARAWLAQRPPAIQGQNGDDHTVVTFFQLRDFGISEAKALDLVQEDDGWNDRCEPPWEPAELANVAHNAYEYASGQAGSKGVQYLNDYECDECQDISTIAFMNENSNDNDETSSLDGSNDVDHQYNNFRKYLNSISARNRDALNSGTDLDYLIPGFMRDKDLIMINMPRGGGKSTFLVDIAIRLSSDLDYHNGFPLKKGYNVILGLGEDPASAQSMLQAWCVEYGADKMKRLHRLDYVPDLTNESECKMFSRYIKETYGGKPTVLLLDTWQTAVGNADQISDKDMNKVIKHLTDYIMPALNGPVITATHPPESDPEKVFGTGQTMNRTTTIIQGTTEALPPDHVRFFVKRIKGQGLGTSIILRRKVVKIGHTADPAIGNRPTYGPVFVAAGGNRYGDDDADPDRHERLQRIAHAVELAMGDLRDRGESGAFTSRRIATHMAGQQWGEYQAGKVGTVLRHLGELGPETTLDYDTGHCLIKKRGKGNSYTFEFGKARAMLDEVWPTDEEEP